MLSTDSSLSSIDVASNTALTLRRLDWGTIRYCWILQNMATVAAAAQLTGPLALAGRVILYDGVCNLSNACVRFVAARDKNAKLKFCCVQSKAAENYLLGLAMSRQDVLHRFVFVEFDEYSIGSTAALQVTGHLRYPWPLFKVLLAVPVPVRDYLFDTVSAQRYAWFGKTSECQVPHSSILERFIDRNELAQGKCSNECMRVEPD